MGLPPWETSDGQLFALITGANSGLGLAVASRMIDEFFTSPSTTPNKHLILILSTRAPMKTRMSISSLRAHLRQLVDYSSWAKKQRKKAKAEGTEYNWMDMVARVHLLGVEVDLCDLRSVYALADQLVNGTVGSPDATTMQGLKLPHGSPGTASYDPNLPQSSWALSQRPGSGGVQRSWGWGLSGLRIPRLDVVVLSAGIGGWVGLNWPMAIKTVLFDTTEAVTWPQYKLSSGGVVKSRSKPSDESKDSLLDNQEKADEPPLNEVFCSNVFGHYILAHELMPLLTRPATKSSQTGGKIIWVSSIEALDQHLSLSDIQGLDSLKPYESSKRLIDILALTSSLPSVQKIAAPFFDASKTTTAKKSPEDGKRRTVKPQLFVTHPGIFASEIMPLPALLVSIYKLVFLFVRWIGSPWHPIEPYKAAVSPAWIALTDNEELAELEANGLQKAKWGSATDASGEERVMRTEVPGWGWNGQVEEEAETRLRKGRKRGAVDVTREKREEFEVTGVEVWKQMEELRAEWEGILGVKRGKK